MTAEDASDDSVRAKLRKAELPLPGIDLLTRTVETASP